MIQASDRDYLLCIIPWAVVVVGLCSPDLPEPRLNWVNDEDRVRTTET